MDYLFVWAGQAEVIFLGQMRHPHLVKLIGYCYQDQHRLLVYEFMARGSLEKHLFKSTADSIIYFIFFINNKIRQTIFRIYLGNPPGALKKRIGKFRVCLVGEKVWFWYCSTFRCYSTNIVKSWTN